MGSMGTSLLAKLRALPPDAYRYGLAGIYVLIMVSVVGLNHVVFFERLGELFSIALMMLTAVIIWNAREYLNNNYLLFIGVSLVFVASLYLLKMLFYGGLPPFPYIETDVTAQLWIAANYVQAASLAIAPIFFTRRLKIDIALMAYAAVMSIALLSIFVWHIFPSSFVNGAPTSFQTISEFIITALFFLALALLAYRRTLFEKNVFQLLCSYIATSVISSLILTLYIGGYYLSSLIGHLLNFLAFYLLYRAVVVTSFRDPYKLLLQSIKLKERELQRALLSSRMHTLEMEALFQSAREALELTEFKDAARTIIAACKKTLGATYGFAALAEPDQAPQLAFCDATLRRKAKSSLLSPLVTEALYSVYDSGRVKVKAFSQSHPGDLAMQNALFAPLTIRDKTVGVLAFLNKQGGFTSNDERVAGAFGNIASLVLQNQWTVDELKANEQKFRAAAESSRNAFVTVDGAGRIVYWNKSAEYIFGYAEHEILDKPFSTLAIRRMPLSRNPASASRDETLVKHLPTADDRRMEMRGKRKSGEEFALEISTSSWEFREEKFFTSIIRDITERKESERKLKEYAELMKEGKARDDALLLSIADGILVTDTSGKIIFVNKALERLSGLSDKNILERDLETILPLYDEAGRRVPKERRPLYIALQLAHRQGYPVSNAANFYLENVKEGTRIPLSISAAPFISENKVLGAVAVLRDITHEKEIDKAKSEFISFASHQLRTPLTSTSLSIDMLLNHPQEELSKDMRRYLKMAMNGIKEMTDIIETLLNISRIQMGTMVVNPEPVNLPRFMDKILQDVSITLKHREIKIRKEYDRTIPDIKIDQRLMKIVLENLISNAMKYSPEQSTIVAEISKRGRDALIAISDTGIGIPKDQQQRIFEKLFRVEIDSKVKGTGLGLYIVKAAVDQYGGRVWCVSPSERAFDNPRDTEGTKGTTFFVTVPLSGMRQKKES